MTKLLLFLFVPNHKDCMDADTRSAFGRLSGIVGIVCNLLLCAAKFVIGTVSGSVAVIADAVNNLADASGSVVTLVGFRMAGKPADKEHPYGHARAEYLAGFIVAMLILFMGFETLKSAVEKLLNPTAVELSVPFAVILGCSVLMKLWLSRFNKKLGKTIDSAALLATGTDCRNDAVSTAAVLAAAIIQALTDINLDGLVGVAMALLILWSGIGVAKGTLSLLLGNGPDQELREKLEKELLCHEKVLGCHDLLVHDYGPGRRFATCHIEMDVREAPMVCHDIIDSMERSCLERLGVHMSIHYDPIVVGDPILDRVRCAITHCVQTLDPAITIHDLRMVPGSLHTKLMFDVELPFRMRDQKEALKAAIDQTVKALDEHYYTVIEFDETDG